MPLDQPDSQAANPPAPAAGGPGGGMLRRAGGVLRRLSPALSAGPGTIGRRGGDDTLLGETIQKAGARLGERMFPVRPLPRTGYEGLVDHLADERIAQMPFGAYPIRRPTPPGPVAAPLRPLDPAHPVYPAGTGPASPARPPAPARGPIRSGASRLGFPEPAVRPGLVAGREPAAAPGRGLLRTPGGMAGRVGLNLATAAAADPEGALRFASHPMETIGGAVDALGPASTDFLRSPYDAVAGALGYDTGHHNTFNAGLGRLASGEGWGDLASAVVSPQVAGPAAAARNTLNALGTLVTSPTAYADTMARGYDRIREAFAGEPQPQLLQAPRGFQPQGGVRIGPGPRGYNLPGG